MIPTDPMVIGLLVGFILTLGIGIFLVLPEEKKIKSWIEKITEHQRQHLMEISEDIKPNSIASKLKRANINIYPGVFYVFCIGAAALVAFIVSNYTKNIVAGLVMAILGYQIPIIILNMINRSYDKKMDIQINLLISATAQTILSSGSMIKTIENISRIVDDPLRSELIKILSSNRLGKPLEQGFVELANKTGHVELTTYARIVNIAIMQGTSVAADSFRRLYKVVEQEEALERDRRSQLSEYTMFVTAVIVGLPLVYFIACSSIDMAYDALITWTAGKVATVAIALMAVGSFFGYKMSTRSI